jgi:hypothetical protein
MQLRLPCPLWFAVCAVVLVIVAVGLTFGIPAYRQWSAIDQIEHYRGFKKGSIRSVGPAWLRRCVGEDRMLAFDEIHSLHFMPDINRHLKMHVSWANGPTGPVIDDAGLRCVTKIHHLKHLHLGCTNISDAAVVHLCSLQKLETLNLEGTDVSDASVPQLKRLTNLEYLNLDWTQVTDDCLIHLRGLPRLKQVSLAGTVVTYAGIDELKQAVPGLNVIH